MFSNNCRTVVSFLVQGNLNPISPNFDDICQLQEMKHGHDTKKSLTQQLGMQCNDNTHF